MKYQIYNDFIVKDLTWLKLIFEINNFDMFIVGGFVRDKCYDIIPDDVDLATNATPDQMIEILDRDHIKYYKTGIEHGTLTVNMEGRTYEITTFRNDVSTDGRRATVKFTNNLQEDLQRRDFTFNAMAFDFYPVNVYFPYNNISDIAGYPPHFIECNLIDYYNGIDDLENSIVKFVGVADDRIKEDYLRIFRYFRFKSRMKKYKSIPDSLKNDIKNNLNGIDKISRERIWSELKKILKGNQAVFVLDEMKELGVLDKIGLTNSKVYNTISDHVIDFVTIFYSVFGYCDFDIKKVWSNGEKSLYDYLNNVRITSRKEAIRKILQGDNCEFVLENFKINGASSEDVEFIVDYEIPEFPVTGMTLIEEGYDTGKKLGDELKRRKDVWIERVISE